MAISELNRPSLNKLVGVGASSGHANKVRPGSLPPRPWFRLESEPTAWPIETLKRIEPHSTRAAYITTLTSRVKVVSQLWLVLATAGSGQRAVLCTLPQPTPPTSSAPSTRRRASVKTTRSLLTISLGTRVEPTFRMPALPTVSIQTTQPLLP